MNRRIINQTQCAHARKKPRAHAKILIANENNTMFRSASTSRTNVRLALAEHGAAFRTANTSRTKVRLALTIRNAAPY